MKRAGATTQNPCDLDLRCGRAFFAAGMIGTAAQHLLAGDFVTRMVPSVPAWLPARTLCAEALGAALAAAAVALFVRRTARGAALLLSGILVLSLLLLHLPNIAARPGFGGAWTNPCKVLALLGGALTLVAIASPRGAARRLELLGRAFLALFLALGGVQHFVYAGFVATLVPDWIPGHLFWTYFAGVALIAGGLGLLAPPTALLAARCSATMIFAWFVLLHIPRALADPHNPMEWAGVCESLAIAGVALLVAATTPARSTRIEEAP